MATDFTHACFADGATATGGCSGDPVFVDCDGNELAVSQDPLGNDVIVVCQDTEPVVTNWDSSATLEPPAPCVAGVYYDTVNECLTHYCIRGILYEMCGSGGGGTTDPTTRVCYDFSQVTNSNVCFGGQGTGWLVDGTNQITPDCLTQAGTRTATEGPSNVFATTAHTGVVPPSQGQLAALLAGAVNTGQGASQATVVTVSGISTVQPWFGAQQPLMILEHDWDPAGTFPSQLFFQSGSNPAGGNSGPLSGDFGIAAWDSLNDQFLPIGSASAIGSPAVITVENIAGMGDWMRVEGDTITAGTGRFIVDFATNAATPTDGVYLIVTGLGQGALPDHIGAWNFDHQIPSAQDCCECYFHATNLAAFLTSIDPVGQTWTRIGTSICADVPDADVNRYGALTMCDTQFDGDIFTLNPNETNAAPVFTSSAAHQAQENQTAAWTATATDDFDTATLVFAIDGGADGTKFQIDSATGVVTFITAPDFETPTDANGDNTYEIIISARDSQGLKTQQFVTVTVTDQFEAAAPIITSPDAVTVDEGVTGVVLDVQTTDDLSTEGAGLTYALTGADSGVLAIDANTGQVTFVTPPDFENPADADGDNVYTATVTVTDAQGLTDTQVINITVADVVENVAPVIISNATVTVPENQTGAIDIQTADDTAEGFGLVYTLTGGADQALFQIDTTTGVVTFITAPNFENPLDANGDNVYEFEVTVTDPEGLTSVQTVAVTIGDEADTPNIIGAPGDDCLDTTGAAYCAECENGTVSWQQLVNGNWVDIP